MSKALLGDRSFAMLDVVTDIEINKDYQLFCLVSVKRYVRGVEAISASDPKYGASFESRWLKAHYEKTSLDST